MSIATAYRPATRSHYPAPTLSRPVEYVRDPQAMVRFDLTAKMEKLGITIPEMAERVGTTEWVIKKWRIAKECPAGLRAELVDPKYWIVTIRGNEYRAYAHHDGGRQVFKLWRSGFPTYTVQEGRTGGVCCTCPNAAVRPQGECKHARALVQLGLLVDAPY